MNRLDDYNNGSFLNPGRHVKLPCSHGVDFVHQVLNKRYRLAGNALAGTGTDGRRNDDGNTFPRDTILFLAILHLYRIRCPSPFPESLIIILYCRFGRLSLFLFLMSLLTARMAFWICGFCLFRCRIGTVSCIVIFAPAVPAPYGCGCRHKFEFVW